MLFNAVVISAIAVLAVIAVKRYRRSMKFGCCGSADGGQEGRRVVVADKDPTHYPYSAVLEIRGMRCENCVRYVENALNEQEGIWATADWKTDAAFVRMKKEYTDAQLKQILRPTGYVLVTVTDRKAEGGE